MATKDEIIADYRKALTEAEGQLKTLQRRLNNCKAAMGSQANDYQINYGHVGNLKHLAAKLKELI